MRTPLRIWARRSSAPAALAAMTVVTALVVASRSGWQWEWNWALSWAASSTIVLSPLLAGLVAFDVQRRLTPVLRLLAATAPRGGAGHLGLVTVLWLGAVVAWLAGTVYAALRVLAAGGGGVPDGWVLLQAPVALAAAAAFGLLIGTVVPNLSAGPLAAVAAYLLPLALRPFGVVGLLTAGGATGSMLGFEPDPTVAAAMVTANALVAVACVLAARARLRPTARAGRAVLGSATAAAVAAVALLGWLDPRTSVLRPAQEAPICVGQETEVCGPPDAAPLLALAEADLTAARRLLQARGVSTTGSYALLVGAERPAPGQGILTIQPEAIRDGHLDRWDVAVTLATPAACPALYGPEPPVALLDAQGRLATWVTGQLDGARADPADVTAARATHAALAGCAAEALPAWDVDGR